MRQIILTTALFLGGLALILSSQMFLVTWVLPIVYGLWLVGYLLLKPREASGEWGPLAEIARAAFPLLVLLGAMMAPLPPDLFEGMAEMLGRGEWQTLDRFMAAFRSLLAVLCAHATYLCLTRSDSPRGLAQNGTLLGLFFLLLAVLVGWSNMASYRDDQKGIMVDGTVLRVEHLDLKGGPIPQGLGAAGEARKGDYIVVFTVAFQDFGRERIARVWRGTFYDEKKWGEMLVKANPPGTAVKVFQNKFGGQENLVVHYKEPPGFDSLQASPNWRKTPPAPPASP